MKQFNKVEGGTVLTGFVAEFQSKCFVFVFVICFFVFVYKKTRFKNKSFPSVQQSLIETSDSFDYLYKYKFQNLKNYKTHQQDLLFLSREYFLTVK